MTVDQNFRFAVGCRNKEAERMVRDEFFLIFYEKLKHKRKASVIIFFSFRVDPEILKLSKNCRKNDILFAKYEK